MAAPCPTAAPHGCHSCPESCAGRQTPPRRVVTSLRPLAQSACLQVHVSTEKFRRVHSTALRSADEGRGSVHSLTVVRNNAKRSGHLSSGSPDGDAPNTAVQYHNQETVGIDSVKTWSISSLQGSSCWCFIALPLPAHPAHPQLLTAADVLSTYIIVLFQEKVYI